MPGAHNVANAAAALTACAIAGAEPAQLAGTLLDFEGAGRRFERLGETASGALVVDDYAHHPTEVRAAILAARTLGRRRVVAVFQPHLFSRTQLLGREFGEALALADACVVLEIYPSRERAEDFPGVSGRLVAEAAADAGGGRPVGWARDFDAAERLLGAQLREGDLCLVLGAGDIDELGRRLVAGAERYAQACPTNTGSGTSLTPNASCTPCAISRASATSWVVVPAPRFVSASVCFEEIAMPVRVAVAAREAGALDEPRRRGLHVALVGGRPRRRDVVGAEPLGRPLDELGERVRGAGSGS